MLNKHRHYFYYEFGSLKLTRKIVSWLTLVASIKSADVFTCLRYKVSKTQQHKKDNKVELLRIIKLSQPEQT